MVVRFRDDADANNNALLLLIDSVHAAPHDVEDEDHENSIWYSRMELAEIEEENDFLVDNAEMSKKRQQRSNRNQFCLIQLILDPYQEQQKQQRQRQLQQTTTTADLDEAAAAAREEVLRTACEKESLEAREKAQTLADKDRIEALNAYYGDSTDIY